MAELQAPTPEIYAREARYMEAMSRHSSDFDKLLESVPESRSDLKEALQGVYNVEPDRLLDREKLAKLKEQNRALFDEVSMYYKNFLEEMIGFK